MNELDEILSGDGNAVPETPTIQHEQPSQPRDESGRFATKQEAPAVVEQSSAEAQQPAEQQPNSNGGVPVGAIQDERQKRQAAQQRADELERQLAELRGQVTTLAQMRQQQATQPEQERQAPSLFEAPEEYISSQLSPVQQQLQETREMLMELQATQLHGAEAVAAAKEAAKVLFNTPEGRALAQKPGNLFDNLVQWHKQQQIMSRIGNDPDAWLNAEIERRLSDPAEQARILERIRNGAASSTNRSQPATNLPPSLSRLPAGGNMPADNDMSDGALFSHATR